MLQIRKYMMLLKPNTSFATITMAKDKSTNASDQSLNPENLSWSTGEKEKPWSKKLNPDDFGKTPFTKKRSIKDVLGLGAPHLDPQDETQKFPYHRSDGGIQYLNFVYYPRFPDQEEPKISPSHLFMIKRRKKLCGRPWWEKVIMRKIGLHGDGRKHEKKNKIVIVKNIPEVNGMLWHVKHLISITPLKLPDNIPDNANPLDFILTDDGEIKYRAGKAPYTEEELLTEILPENQIHDYHWVDDQMRKIYRNSLDNDF